MKKLLLKMISAVCAVALSTGLIAGCGLFQADAERDMAQVVATVQINETITPKNIYKRDMTAAFVSYGYNYVQNYSYTTSAAYKLILDNLVNNAVIVQQSRYELAEKSATAEYKKALIGAEERKTSIENLYNDGYLYLFASDEEKAEFNKTTKEKAGTTAYVTAFNKYVYDLYKDKTDYKANYDAFAFISEKDAYAAIATAIDNVNGLIDSFASTDEEEDEHEEYSYTVRTTPTMEAEEEDDAKLLEEYKAKKIDVSGDRAATFGKAKARLVNLNLIGKDETVDGKETKVLLSYSYFNDVVKSAADSAIVSVYEQALKNMSDINYANATAENKDNILDNLWAQYEELKRTQKAEYDGSLSAYETQLAAVGENTFVAYNPRGGYFYVSHLLIGYTDEQKAAVDKITSDKDATDEWIQNEVDKLASEIVIEDQRASWVLSNYGTYNGNDFTFSDKYVYDTEGELAKFRGKIGEVKTYKDKDDDGNEVNLFAFADVKAEKIPYADFTKLAAKYITGNDGEIVLNTLYDGTAGINRIDEEIFNRFEDLKFAFSTDTGNFNNYLGYVYSPITSKKQYVSAFANACAEIAEKENKVGAYKMFMSKEYGLHIVLCTATADYGVYADKAAFKADLDKADNKDTVAYLFMQAQVDLVTDTYISDIAQSFINEYTKDGATIKGSKKLVVTYNEQAYNDLITE